MGSYLLLQYLEKEMIWQKIWPRLFKHTAANKKEQKYEQTKI